MRISGAFRAAAATLALMLFPCAPAFAEEGAALDQAAVVARAKKMIFAGKPLDALDLLRPLAELEPDNTDAHFFRGMAALAAARLPKGAPDAPAGEKARRKLRDEAVESYRRILRRRPGLAGARLRLAQSLFERGRCLGEPEDLLEHLFGDDCDAAAHHFRRALAGRLPDKVAGAVARYLAVVQARKRVSGHFSMAFAPDSNVNAGTDAKTFRLRWLPLEFKINEDARKTSGAGVVVSASGDYRHPLKLEPLPRMMTRLRVGGGFHRREYDHSAFDDMTVFLHAGPEALFPRGRVSLLGRAERRWYAGEPISYGLGARLEGVLRVGRRLWLGGAVERMERRHRGARANDGPRLDVDLNAAFQATPAVTLGGRGGWNRTLAKSPSLRARTRKMGGFASFRLPPVLGVAGFGLALSHDVLLTAYDDPGYFLISPNARRDRLSLSRVTIFNETLEMFGFTPALSLARERRDTNILDIFDYSRHQAEISLRRVF